VIGYANLYKIKLGKAQANSLGRKASAYCRKNGMQKEEVFDSMYGTVGNYPQSALNLRNILNQQSIDAAVKLLKNPNLQNTEKPATQKPSCWNCKHCSREFTEDKHTYYCYKFGLLSFLEKDCETRADDCPAWNYRLEKTTNSTTLDNPSYFTLMLPSHLKFLIEDAAKISGMSLIDWAGHHLLKAIELSKTTAKITH
jgi:hypothetical protein